MVESLYIRPLDDPGTVAWTVLDEHGRVAGAGGRGSLLDAARAAEHRRVVLLVPGLDVVAADAELPAASPARLRQMVPYALEDSLAQDVDRLLFAVGPRSPSGTVRVSVVARELLDRWLANLAAVGLRPHAAYSDAEGVPDTAGTLTLVLENDRIYGRRPDQAPFVLESLGLSELLELLRAGHDGTDLQHVLVYADENAAARHREELTELRNQLASIDLKSIGDTVVDRLSTTLAQRPGTNLLQGPYARQSDWVALLQPWRVAAALLIALGVLGVAAQAVQYLSLQRTDSLLSAQVLASCEHQFGLTAAGPCEAEARRRLEAAGEPLSRQAGENFLSAVAAVAASRPRDSRIESLDYRNRVMNLQLVAPSVPALDEFTRRLAEGRRFEARIQSTRPGDSGVESRIQIVSAVQ